MILKRVEILNKDLDKVQDISSAYGCIDLKTEAEEVDEPIP